MSARISTAAVCWSGVPAERDLTGRHRDRAERVAQPELRRVDALGHVVPWLAVASLRGFLATGIGQREEALATVGVGGDETLVLEQLQRGVDRTGTRPPHPVGPLLELLDHLVPVHRPLGEQGEGGGPHITATGPAAGATAAAASAASEPEVLGRTVPAAVFTGFGVLVLGSHQLYRPSEKYLVTYE